MKTLITFLGRVPKQSQGEYRRARYQFPDGIRETAYIGLELTRYLRPDHLIVLGTDGSQWELLVLQGQGEDRLEWALAIEQAIGERRLTQDMLDRAAPCIEAALGCRVSLRLIPYGREQAEQASILQLIARMVAEGEVHFDVTHAFRHLSMIAFTAAFLLQELGRLRVGGLWYGALEMDPGGQGAAPVVKLDGLLNAQAWVAALARYDAAGDYGVFADLLKKDGFAAPLADSLREAAFLERTTDVHGAAAVLRRVFNELKRPLRGASEIFRDSLMAKLRWARSGDLADHQKQLAWSYLEREDYLRAAIFAVEACISRACWHEGRKPTDKNARARFAGDEGLDSLKCRLPGAGLSSFLELKRLRNCLAHGFTRSDEPLRAETDSPDRMRRWMQQRMAGILGSAGDRWPW